MARKSKQAGSGHMPLTNYERNKYGKQYGLNTVRLGGGSQYSFGHCALSLHPAKQQPVATPAKGFIYERPAMLEYLLHQTQQLKEQQQRYEQWQQTREAKKSEEQEKKRKAEVEKFESSQTVMGNKKSRTDEDKKNPLKNSSFWLADFQPKKEEATTADKADGDWMEPPPKRPPSPMSQTPLRRKDLIPLELKRNKDDQVICAISEKSIVSQQALALITSKSGDESKPAQVVLESVFKDLGVGDYKVCPVTGRKIVKVLKLQKGGSSFAASAGEGVQAQTYRPTMT